MIDHNGYTFCCAAGSCDQQYTSRRSSMRGAIADARSRGWFVGRVRVTAGAKKRSAVRTVNRELCPHCKWLVGQ